MLKPTSAIATLLLFAAWAQPTMAKPACAPPATATDDVTATLRAMFAAVRADDAAAFHAVLTPDFYAYDAGMNLTADALLQLIVQAHAAGKKYEWNVTDPKVHASCDSAWVTYVNRGAVEDAGGRQEVTWLESVVLHYDGRWRVQFLHSTRTPKPLP